MNKGKILLLLEADEGLKLKPYKDTVGKWTIGIGRNLEDNGISKNEAYLLLSNDIDRCIKECQRAFEWFDQIDSVRQDILICMVFNMGLQNLLEFRKMLAYMAKGNFKEAAFEMLDSHWLEQVGKRAFRLAKMMESGQYLKN